MEHNHNTSVTYDKYPTVRYRHGSACAWQNNDVWNTLFSTAHNKNTRLVIIDCYPGVDVAGIVKQITACGAGSNSVRCIDAETACRGGQYIQMMIARNLTDDRVFGIMSHFSMADFFDPQKTERIRRDAQESVRDGNTVTIFAGVGAAHVCGSLQEQYNAVLVYADMPRREIQMRMRAGMGNWRAENPHEDMLRKYKRAYFVEWRTADRHKKQLFARADFFLDTTDKRAPKLVDGSAMRAALCYTVRRPFRVKPFFDPGVWGGQWMKKICGLDNTEKNYAWCFDCVPEENSLLLEFDDGVRVEIPSVNAVFFHPIELLGDKTHARFGAEFPIRFDFLDTMGGQHLSLQIHPLTEYIYETFGMTYTQDESYYMLDAGNDACVYLGLKKGVDSHAMLHDLHRAQNGEISFPDEKYVNKFAAKKHDHFLIPAGTVHCSGKNSMVLEISATPYIFTFKLWDWGRVGLDGKPRPVHLEHGARAIQWERTTSWVENNLINRAEKTAAGDGWIEERTGLHERQFIETRRHIFSKPVHHNTHGTVNVLNLVQGDTAIVRSPSGSFDDFEVHYAETFIVPAAVGEFIIEPVIDPVDDAMPCMTMKAWVRGSEM